MKLEIIKEIESTSIEAVVQKYALNYKDCEHKFLLKYDQINSIPFKGIEAVKECRGIVINKADLKVLSLPFKRFFNNEEKEAAQLDHNKSVILKKEDGSVIGFYFDEVENSWCVQTSGTPDANTKVGEHDMTFKELFWNVFNSYNTALSLFDKDKNYVFELCTPFNQVVKFHEKSKLVLLNVRDMVTFGEVDYNGLCEISKKINIPAVEKYELNAIDELKTLFKDMAADEEGFVVFDGKNRVKVKNPAYVLKSKTKDKYLSKDIFEFVKDGERDELLAVNDEYELLYTNAENFFLKLQIAGYRLRECANIILCDLLLKRFDDERARKKEFVGRIQQYFTDENSIFQSAIYKMAHGQTFDPRDFLCGVSNEILYKKMKNK